MSEGPDIPDALGKKVGPLPLGVWLLAVAGGVGVAWWVRSHGSSGGTDTVDPTVPDGTNYTQPNGVGQDDSSSDSSSGTGSIAPAPTTNEEWGQQAIRQMIARGYDPTTVDKAIRDYLAGNTLTTVERALIAETLAVFGPPPVPPPPEVPGGTVDPPTTPVTSPPKTTPDKPSPTPPTKSKPKPAPKPTNVYPKKWKTVVNGTNSNYSKIAAKYKLNISGNELYQYQLSKNAGRPASTVATLRKRGPNLIYAAGTTVLPYPRK